MTLGDLVGVDHPTSLGPIRLWSPPGHGGVARPALVTITGPFAPADAMSRLPVVIGEFGECHLMHLPGNHAPGLADMSIEGVARALAEVIDTRFPGRAVVLQGLSVGALVAMAVRSAAVRKVVAVEPPLSTAKLWPLRLRLQAQLAAAPIEGEIARFLDAVFGLTSAGQRDIAYRHLFAGGRRWADVVVGETPLMPPRELERYPSFLDEEDRAFLRAQAGVSLHIAADAGHNVPALAPGLLRDLLVRACREAVAGPSLAPWQAVLLERTPAAAARLCYRGKAAGEFAAACRARNPKARLVEAGAEALILERLDPCGEEADRLVAGGHLLGVVPPAVPAVASALIRRSLDRGFELLQLQPLRPGAAFFDDDASNLAARFRAGELPAEAAESGLLLVARRKSEAPAPPATRLCLASFAPQLMDIRARLPAQAMRSEPDLVVSHQRHDYRLPATEPDAPRILVLQRPALLDPVAWTRAMTNVMRAGWIVVLECDDHPALMAELTGAAVGEADWRRFGYVHAVQTSTAALAEAFRAFNPEVEVFANAAFELAPFPTAASRRVFYGAVTRGPYAVEVARALAPTLRRFPEVEFVVVGDRAVFEALATDNKRYLPLLGYADYLAEMGRCAVSLSPVEPRRHMETKSDAKFVEAASRGVLTIGSPVVYGEAIRHGETGLLAAEIGDWPRLLAQALEDEPARRRMAEAAWAYVRAERMAADQIKARRAWYETLWARRAELDAAVMRRLAGASLSKS